MILPAALAWVFSNVRQIGPENHTIVLCLGALERLAGPGLLLVWLQPLEQVVLLPPTEQAVERRVEGLPCFEQTCRADLDVNLSSDALAGSGYLLTGSAEVVRLDMRVLYKVDDPYGCVLQNAHVLPMLDRLAVRNAVQVCAVYDLNTILMACLESLGNDSAAAERRERLRSDLVQGISHSLAALAAAGSGLGIQVVWVDVQLNLSCNTVSAFNVVLTASQLAEQNVTKARTEARKLTQVATEGADRTLQVVRTEAGGWLAQARRDTASIVGLAPALGATDLGLLWCLYHERVPTVLGRTDSIDSVDPHDDNRLILQDGQP